MDLEALDTGRLRFLECKEMYLDVDVEIGKSGRILIVFRPPAGMLRVLGESVLRPTLWLWVVESEPGARRVQTPDVCISSAFCYHSTTGQCQAAA